MHIVIKDLLGTGLLLRHPYLFASICMGIATVLRLVLDPILQEQHPLVPYYGALAAAAWRGGWGPALFSLVSSYLVADWFFLPPRQELSIFRPEPFHLVGCVTFFGTGLVIAAFSEAIKQAKQSSQSSTRLAERESKKLQAVMVDRFRPETAPRESQQRLRFVMDAARMVSWDLDFSNDVRTFSGNAPAVLGVSPCDFNRFLSSVHPDDVAAHERSLAEAIRNHGSYISQFRLIRPDNGLTIWLEDRATVSCDHQGNVIGMSGIIMERKLPHDQVKKAKPELEDRVQARTVELAEAGKESEAFSYSVSNDLRGTSIKSDVPILKESCQRKLETVDQEMLVRVLQSGQHMEEVLTGLLSLARVSRENVGRDLTHLSALAREIVAGLRTAEPDRPMDIEIEPGLSVQGDPRLLRIALENLLRNAWKFTSRCDRGCIEFGAWSDKGKLVYFVRDNGAGFDMARSAELFGVFHRLHSDADFPGIGIGLAIVHRIINRHGGQVWAEATVNQGATFYFTLPADPAPPVDLYLAADTATGL